MARTVSIGSAAGAQTSLLWNKYQVAFLQALDARNASGRRVYDRLSLFAGRRGGKTRVGGIAAVKSMQPNTLGWACAPSYPELEDYVMPAVLSLVPRSWIAEWSQSRRELTLKNGARCAFRSLDDPERGRGPGLDWCWIDEARKVQELAWKTISPAVAGNAGVAWFTTTPNGFDWCYKQLWLRADESEPGYWACKYWTSEQAAFPKEEIERERRTMDPTFFAQEYQADFVTFTGAIYGKSINNQVLLNNDPRLKKIFPEWPKIDSSRPCYVGIDPGADHPFAAVLLVSTEMGLVQIAEYIARNKSAYEHKRGISAMLSTWNQERPFMPERWAIDRSQRQMAIELAQAPFAINCTAAENDVRAGINRTQAWFQSGQLWILGESCKRTVEQLRGYRWDENIAPDGTYRKESPRKEEDDLPDALRYVLMLWPEAPEVERVESMRVGLEGFSAEQMWAVDRMSRIDKKAAGLIEPEDDELGSSADEGPTRRYFDDDAPDAQGTGDLWG